MTDIAAERLRVMDGIVGLCIRDLDFGRRVLADPTTTLAPYDLEPDELDDFLALSAVPGVLDSWRSWHHVFIDGGALSVDGANA